MRRPSIGGKCSGCGLDYTELNLEHAKGVLQNHFNITGEKFYLYLRENKLTVRSLDEANSLVIIFPGSKIIDYDFC